MADIQPWAAIATAVVGAGSTYLGARFPGSRRRRRRDKITIDIAFRNTLPPGLEKEQAGLDRLIRFNTRNLLAAEEPWTTTEDRQGMVGWFSLTGSMVFLGVSLFFADFSFWRRALGAVAFLFLIPYPVLHLKRASTRLKRQNNLVRDGEVSPPPAP